MKLYVKDNYFRVMKGIFFIFYIFVFYIKRLSYKFWYVIIYSKNIVNNKGNK